MSSLHFFPPTQIGLLTAVTVTSLGLGFYLGTRSAPSNSDPAPEAVKDALVGEDSGEDSGEEDEEEASDGDLATVKAGYLEPCKMVLVVRTDLNMTPGKIAAQCGHATLACYKSLMKKNPQLVRHWEHTGQAKIALKATSEEQFLELEAIAKSLNLCARSIQDQGRTQVAGGTKTVLGIGPAPVQLINEVTGALRLL